MATIRQYFSERNTQSLANELNKPEFEAASQPGHEETRQAESEENQEKSRNGFFKRFAGRKENASENDDLRKKLWIHQVKKNIMAILVTAAVLVIGYQLFVHLYNKVYTGIDVEKSFEFSGSEDTEYIQFGSKVLAYNHDGISCMDENGSIVWNQAFEVEDIVYDICGEYAAFSAQGGTTLYVVKTDGSKQTMDMVLPIRQVRVTESGMAAVLLEDENVFYMRYMSSDGIMQVEGKIHMNDTGYPLDFDISPDGKKLAFSYLYFSEGVLKTKIAFYNFGSVGQEQENHMVKTVSYNEEMFPRIAFLSEDISVAFGNRRIVIFQGRQKPEPQTEIEVEKEIKSIFYNGNSFGIVQGGDKDSAYLLTLYDTKGHEIFQHGFSEDYKEISMEEDRILIFGGNRLIIWKTNGDKKYEGDYPAEIEAIISSKYLQRYTIFTKKTVDKIRLK